MVRKNDFNESVSLPPGLTVAAIRRAIDFVEREATGLVEIYYEQANIFSGVVGILGTKALDSISEYEKCRHIDLAQQRFPDLKRRGSGDNPAPNLSLECKGSKRPWAVQSHYDHAGWYIIWRYLVDATCTLEKDKPVIVWRVDVAFFEKSDWKYEKSSAGSKGGGRTHTFRIQNPAKKLKDKAVYKRSDVKISGGKAVPSDGD